MTKFDVLFGMPQKMGSLGMMAMWSSFYIITIICMLVDDTEGKVRNFSLASQAVCCINLCAIGWAITTKVDMVQASLYTMNADLGATILAWAYFGGDVFSSSALGIWNYFHVIMGIMFFVNNMVGLAVIAMDHDGWLEFLGEANNAGRGDNQV